MQSKRDSFFESITNIAVGYVINVTVQIVVFPMFGLHASLHENLMIGVIFTFVSVARSYTIRRIWNGKEGKQRARLNRRAQ